MLRQFQELQAFPEMPDSRNCLRHIVVVVAVVFLQHTFIKVLPIDSISYCSRHLKVYYQYYSTNIRILQYCLIVIIVTKVQEQNFYYYPDEPSFSDHEFFGML